MIEGLKPYAGSAKPKAMTRTSAINIPWLTAIPEHWKVVRAKGLFTARTERARPDDEQLSATQAYGVIPQKEFERRVGRKVVQITQHLDKRAHVEPDDFVISMRSFQGGLERAWARGCIRSSYVVLKPSPETKVGYFAHLFKSRDYIQALQATGNFIRDGQDLNFNNFSLVDLPLPPPDEQSDIAKCLDHANRKIDGFIRAKRKLIGLLNEQKQAIIHRAVTRGLHPDVPLKPSGIPWLGDIPQHWDVRRVKFVVDHYGPGIQMGPFGSSLTSLETRNTGFKLYGQENTISGDFTRGSRWLTREQFESLRKYELLPGDIVLTRKGSIGKARIVPAGISRGLADSDTIRVRLDRRLVVPEFVVEVLHTSTYVLRQLEMSRRGAILGGLNTATIGDILLVLPPENKQSELLAGMRVATAPLNTAIARTEREIALMQEYRTRLTADLVTGKLDVREAAAKLPDLPAGSAAETISGEDVLEETETMEEEG